MKKKECCDLVVNNLNHFITIPIQGKLTQKKIFQSLIGMAVSQQSIHSISHSLILSPCETSLRYHLKKLNISELEEINSQILTHSIYDVLKTGHPYHFAIDFTHDPYYGDIVKDNEGFFSRNRLKKSTKEFYSYITLYIITKDRQFTLAVFPVRQGLSKVYYIARYLDVISNLGPHIEVFCLDREFYTKKVISFLQNTNIPFIMPVRRHSYRMKSLLEGTKSRIMIGVICIPVSAPMRVCQDLKAGGLSYPSTVNREGEFTITIEVSNVGYDSSSGGDIQVTLPDGSIIKVGQVPPLRHGQKKEITFTITIPPGTSIGNNSFTVNLNPYQNSECSLQNNQVSGTTFVLPEGMTQEEYESQTNPPFYKITGPPFVNPSTGGGGPPPPP